MSKFSIDTDKVDNVADDINSLSPKASSIKASVSGYDVSNPDGFDFSGAKEAIAHNIEGVETKINNTVKLLNAVVGTHSGLQNSVNDNSSSDTSTPTSYSSSDYSYSSSGSSSGGAYYTGALTGGGSGYYGESDTSSSKKTTKKKKKKKKKKTEQLVVETNTESSVLDYEPFSVFSDKDLSAGELLNVELGATATTTAAGVSSLLTNNLTEEINTNTSSNTITPDEISYKSQGQTIIVLESSSKELSNYKQIVQEVATENGIGFNLLMLDSIIETKQLISGLDIKLSNAIETNATSTEDTKDKDENEQELNTLDKIIDDEESDKELSLEEQDIITDKEEDNTNNKDEELPYAIINQRDYDTLMNIPTAGTAKNDLKITPVTLIIRNGIIIYSINGETTKEILNQAIQSLGVGRSNIIK